MFFPFELWFPAFFFTLWLGIFALAARLGGWHALGQRFRAYQEPQGECFRWQSISMGHSNYGGCTRIVVAPIGLYLQIPPAFRCFHPSLLIPWSELRVVRVRQGRFVRDASVEIGQPVLACVRLPLRVVEAASEYLLKTSAS